MADMVTNSALNTNLKHMGFNAGREEVTCICTATVVFGELLNTSSASEVYQ